MQKPADYYDGMRADFVGLMAPDPEARVLEIGCAKGATGWLAKKEGKCGTYVGVEIDPACAQEAREVLDRVVEGNIEQLDLANLEGPFDYLVASEVLEHLKDPSAVLHKLKPLLKPGARVFASSPNIASRRIITELLRGNFDYTPSGVMDRTHLRWFTPRTYRALFEEAGFETLDVHPLVPKSGSARLFDKLTRQRWQHLSVRQIVYVGRVPTA